MKEKTTLSVEVPTSALSEPVSVEHALCEVNRELNVRLRIFPRWVKDGKLDSVDAQDRIDRLSKAKDWLTALVAALKNRPSAA